MLKVVGKRKHLKVLKQNIRNFKRATIWTINSNRSIMILRFRLGAVIKLWFKSCDLHDHGQSRYNMHQYKAEKWDAGIVLFNKVVPSNVEKIAASDFSKVVERWNMEEYRDISRYKPLCLKIMSIVSSFYNQQWAKSDHYKINEVYLNIYIYVYP